MEILDDNEQNWLILTEDGSTDSKTKSSDLNQLLYGHDLFGLLDRGDEIWMHNGAEDEQKVTIIPGEDDQYTIRPENAPDLTIGAHHKTDLVDAMATMYEDRDGESVAPILNLYDSIREDMIRDKVLEPFAKAFSDKVEVKADGWFLNGHLLLTFEGEFYHPSTNSRKRAGNSVVGVSSSTEAYSVVIGDPEDAISRDITLDGEDYRLTDKEIRFLARMVWAVENTPDRRADQ
jgi:hypothetical protein